MKRRINDFNAHETYPMTAEKQLKIKNITFD